MAKRKYIEACKIINTHGVRGAVKADVWCDTPETLCAFPRLFRKKGDEYIPIKIISGSVFKNFALLYLENVNTLEDAAKLKETILYADRDDIPLEEGAHLIDDIKGLPVFDADSGERYGTVKDIYFAGASDMYEIDTGHSIALVPAVKEFIIRVDTDSGVYIRPIEGLLDPI